MLTTFIDLRSMSILLTFWTVCFNWLEFFKVNRNIFELNKKSDLLELASTVVLIALLGYLISSVF